MNNSLFPSRAKSTYKSHSPNNEKVPIMKEQHDYTPKRIRINKAEEERNYQIAKSNRLFIERIKKILLEKPKFLHNAQIQDQNWLTQRNTFSYIRRKMNLEKITDENKEIFQRIENQKTFYSYHDFEADRKKKEKILKSISKYPMKLQVFSENKDRYENKKLKNQNEKIQFLKEKFDLKDDSEENEGDNHKVLYNQFHMIEKKHFQIEISKLEKDFQIAALDLKTNQIHILKIQEEFFYKLLKHIDYKYSEIIKHLSFKDEKLILQIEKNESFQNKHRRLMVLKKQNVVKREILVSVQPISENKEKNELNSNNNFQNNENKESKENLDFSFHK